MSPAPNPAPQRHVARAGGERDAASSPAPGLGVSRIRKQAQPSPAGPEQLPEPQEPEQDAEWESTVKIFRDGVKIHRKLRHPDGTPRPRPGGGRRGRIRGLSKASAGRLRFLLQNAGRLPYVLHLTYPLDFPTDGARVKLDWKALREWLVRQGLGGVWVQEFQERGAPHLMVLLNGSVPMDAVAARWAAIVNSDAPEHLRTGTRVERVRNYPALVQYMVKKADDPQKQVPPGFQQVGKFWGSFGGVQAEPVQVLQGSREELAPAVRTLRNLENSRRRTRTRQLPPGKRVPPLKDNGVSGWTAPGLAPAALRCMERLGLLDPSPAPDAGERLARTLTRTAPPARESSALPALRAPRPAWEMLLGLLEDPQRDEGGARRLRGRPRDLAVRSALRHVSAERRRTERMPVKRLTAVVCTWRSLQSLGRPPPWWRS